MRTLPASPDFRVFPDPPRSPIFSIRTHWPRELADACQARGFVVRPIVYPTVPAGAERVRVCLHADNTTGEVDRLLATVKGWLDATSQDRSSALATRHRL